MPDSSQDRAETTAKTAATTAPGVFDARAAALDKARLDALADLTGGDPDVLREIVGAFVEDTPDRLREIRDGIAAGDAELVRRAAHSLKSNALTFGALELGEACRELEERVRAGDLAGVSALAARVELEWERVRLAIEALAR